MLQKRPLHRNLIAISSLLMILTCPYGNAADISHKLLVAYTINILKYTHWQPELNTVTLCIDENSSPHSLFESVNEYPVSPRQMLKVERGIQPHCHVVIWDQQSLAQRSSGFRENQLEIADTLHATEEGVDIAMFIENNRLKLKVKQRYYDQTRYKLSSKLLRLSIVSIEP